MTGKFTAVRYSWLALVMLTAAAAAGCGHQPPPAAPLSSAPPSALPAAAASPQAQQNKQAFTSRMKQIAIQRAQATHKQ